MSSESQNISEFARVLGRLMDESGVFKGRGEWAEFLNVSQSAISQWLNDVTVPRPELLRMIVDLVRSVDAPAREPLQEFERMAARPAAEVSARHGKKFGESVNAYLVRPLLEGFLLDLKGLKAEAQTRVLLKASMLCAEEHGIFPDLPVEAPYEALALVASQTRVQPIERPAGPSRALLEAAEATVARLEQRVPGFLSEVMSHLTDTPGEGLLPEVRSFCVQAVAHVQTLNNKTPRMIVSRILESKAIDPSRFNRLSIEDALNTLFLADEETDILVRQQEKFVRLEHGDDVDLGEAVAALRSLEVQYTPAKSPQSYRSVHIESLKDAA